MFPNRDGLIPPLKQYPAFPPYLAKDERQKNQGSSQVTAMPQRLQEEVFKKMTVRELRAACRRQEWLLTQSHIQGAIRWKSEPPPKRCDKTATPIPFENESDMK